MVKISAYTFYIDHGNTGEYYSAVIEGEMEDIFKYLESISREVEFGGELKKELKKPADKKIPCGTLLQYKFYGRVLPKGLPCDRRYTKWQDTLTNL